MHKFWDENALKSARQSKPCIVVLRFNFISLKKIPQRMCAGCNEKKDKKELIRIVRNKDNNIEVDIIGKTNGRGTYICNNIECLDKAIKTKRIERSFDTKIDEKVYEKLRGVIIDKSRK